MSINNLFNDNWYFSKQPLNTTLEVMESSSIDWKPVSIPHDWLIYDAQNLYENGEGWYRKTFTYTESLENNHLSIRFEGVYMNSTVYVNGNLAGTWKYGYSTFEFDITNLLVPGENVIMVQVIHESPNSRWYSGAGIYRNVWLKTYPEKHLVSDGIYISTRKDEDGWVVEVDSELMDSSLKGANSLKLVHKILDPSGKEVASMEATELSLPADGKVINDRQSYKIIDPQLWDLKSPNLYTLHTRLLWKDQVIEEEENRFGFRTLTFTTDKGFFLNGQYVKLYGVCQHHDLGCLGSAVNKEATRRQLRILKEMGVNAIRTSHNMPSVELMELSDEMGILIQTEAFDMWERRKTTYDYARFFPEWAEKDVASWVRRDRNHPSLIMWSIGNEIYDTHAGERGLELTKMLRDLVLIHDPKGNAPITIGSNYMPWEGAQNCADILKLAGYNYAEKYYEDHHKAHPDWIIYGSETSSTVQSRGIYHFPVSQSVLSDDDEQCSSLGNSSTSWGAKSTEACIISDRDAAFSLGQFLWTGFDYIGEPTPYHTKNSYFGQIDTAGFKKDSFYIYQAEWTNYKESPMVHIFPYWDFSEGQLIDVRVCSNAPKVELFLNGESQGVHNIDHAHGDKLVGDWQLPYTKGELRAVAYDEADNPIAEDRKISFQDAASLVLTTDKTEMTANGNDLIFLEISAEDENHNPVENANNRVHISVEGPGKLVGLDNGDSTDYEQYKGTNRRMFSGKLLAVIASTFEAGTITVKAESKGVKAAELNIVSKEGEIVPGSSELMACPETPSYSEEVPIRKLEIVCPQGNRITKEHPTLTVHVTTHPIDADDQEIIWRLTTVAGVDSPLASLEADGKTAKITGKGDGRVYIRCAVKNGSDKIRMYSQLEVEITGLGEALLDPYGFISASVYTYSNGALTNGNDRGMATSRDGESHMGFDGIDFGEYGSDEITLPIFCLDSEKLPIEIWQGIPGKEDAQLIDTVIYQKPSKWNTYQEETFKLPKRLKGITSLCFVLQRKAHIKGFYFKKLEKAFEQLSILENNGVYGDEFTITDQAIENIGNNVSIVYDAMDFGSKGCSKIKICGHSPIDKNTITLLFSGEEGESRQVVEFTHSDGYAEKEFDLSPVNGLNKVTFVFLPGSQFNFKWFRFQ